MTKMPDEVVEYIQLVESEVYRNCNEQKAFCKYLKNVFENESIIIEYERIEKYLSLEKYYSFKLLPWEKCLITLWLCCYEAPGVPRWKTLFSMLGRGAGKDGFISFTSHCLISPFNPVGRYDVDICANNEEQAMRPVKDLSEILENPKFEKKLKKHFYHTKELITGLKNRGTMRGRTNNPKGRDGMRSGATVFNEVHAYQNYDNIKVFVTGQGKVAEPRVGIFTSNGDVNDGPLDDYLARGQRILFEGEKDNGFLPFVCKLNNKKEVNDKLNWYMANPSLYYFPHLLKEIEDEYSDWVIHPEQNPDFLTKRMGLRAGFNDISVTDYEKVLLTKKELPDLKGRSCVVGIDYAELSDWAAVNIHFKDGNIRYDINHAWICGQSKTLSGMSAPWRDWVMKGDITYVDEPTIPTDLIAEYIREAGRIYNIKKIALDHFRWTLISESIIKIGFDANDKNKIKLIRPSDIMMADSVIQNCFDNEYFVWGDVPHLRWAVNNTKRVRSSRNIGCDTGNYIYAKIEAKYRKTDPFMALVASMTIEDVLVNSRHARMPKIGAIVY